VIVIYSRMADENESVNANNDGAFHGKLFSTSIQ